MHAADAHRHLDAVDGPCEVQSLDREVLVPVLEHYPRVAQVCKTVNEQIINNGGGCGVLVPVLGRYPRVVPCPASLSVLDGGRWGVNGGRRALGGGL